MKNIFLIFSILFAGFFFNSCEEEEEIMGCMDHSACNYNADATQSDASCEYPIVGYDCGGNCLDEFQVASMPASGENYDFGNGTGTMLDYGFFDSYYYYVEDGWSYDIHIMSEGLSWSSDFSTLNGSGHYMVFSVYFGDGNVAGSYIFNQDFGITGTFASDYSWYAINQSGISLADGTANTTEFQSGTVDIMSLGGDNYEISFSCMDASGSIVSGCYTGSFDYLEYYYSRNGVNKNFPNTLSTEDRKKEVIR